MIFIQIPELNFVPFRDTTTGFPAKWHLRNDCRNTAQNLVVQPHQYGISVVVFHSSEEGLNGVVASFDGWWLNFRTFDGWLLLSGI